MPSLAHPETTLVGLDVHKDSVSVAVLSPRREVPGVDKIFHDEESIRRLVARLSERRVLLRTCY